MPDEPQKTIRTCLLPECQDPCLGENDYFCSKAHREEFEKTSYPSRRKTIPEIQTILHEWAGNGHQIMKKEQEVSLEETMSIFGVETGGETKYPGEPV